MIEISIPAALLFMFFVVSLPSATLGFIIACCCAAAGWADEWAELEAWMRGQG